LPLAIAFGEKAHIGVVFKGWKRAVRHACEAAEWGRRRKRALTREVMVGWRTVWARRRSRRMNEMVIMKKRADDRLKKMDELLTASRSIAAWRHAAFRSTATRATLADSITRRHRICIASTFAAWARISSRSVRSHGPFRHAVRDPARIPRAQQPTGTNFAHHLAAIRCSNCAGVAGMRVAEP
jgi:hypothetical protein